MCEQLGVETTVIDDVSPFEDFVLVDASSVVGLPSGLRPADVREVIDHRLYNDCAAFPRARFRIEPVGAAATQIAEHFYFNEAATLSPVHAALLRCAIHSNTVNFWSDTTGFRDHRMNRWLLEKEDSRWHDLPARMFEHKSRYALEHLAEALASDCHDTCTQFGFDQPVAVFQLETSLAAEVLRRRAEVLRLGVELFPERPRQLVILHDALAARTWLLFNHPEVGDRLKATSLALRDDEPGVMSVAKGITMRKSVLKAVLDGRR